MKTKYKCMNQQCRYYKYLAYFVESPVEGEEICHECNVEMVKVEEEESADNFFKF